MVYQDAPKDAPSFDTPSYCRFLRKAHKQGAPLVAKTGKKAIAALIGVQWRHVETIFTKFKLLNTILIQFVDCHVCIMIYYGIAIHTLV